MEVFAEFLAKIDVPRNRERTAEILAWVMDTFPGLAPRWA